MTETPEPMIAVLGEALIDIVEAGDDEPRLARPGGGPYNIAIGLARLGRRVAFVGRLSRDPLGTILRNHALRSAVDLSRCVDTDDPTTVALVELRAGSAEYRFGITGTADFQWTDAELAGGPVPAAVHFGSLASWTPTGDAALLKHVAEMRESGALISYDPNVRPHLQPDAVAARRHIESALRLAHLVKTSDEDLAWLYPGADPDDIAQRWLAAGPDVVVITRGGDGSSARTRAGAAAHRPIYPITMIDTVGAGDSFMSGLLDALARRGSLTPAIGRLSATELGDMLDDAALVAAVTCGRAGANPPRRAELATYRPT